MFLDDPIRMPRSIFLVSLVLFLITSAFAKEESWLEIRTSHFVVITNAGEKQARGVADQFERMRTVFHRAFPTARVDAASPIVVIAVKNRKDFAAMEPQEYLAKGKLELAGFFLRTQDKNYVLLRLDAGGDHPYATIYHEYTHFMVSRAAEWLPLWFNEGLAEFYQNTEIREKEVLLGQPDADNIMLLRENKLLPLSTLFTIDRDSPYYHEQDKGSIFYAQSWALMHYLQVTARKTNTDLLGNYLTLISQNVDSVAAAAKAFGDLNQLQKQLQEYVKQERFQYFLAPGKTEVDESTLQLRPLTGFDADAIRADLMASDRREKDARALLDSVLKQDPNNVSARETLGMLAMMNHNLDEAGKWYGEAVRLDSKSYLAHYYYAMSIMMRGGDTSAQADQVEASLVAATKLNPSFAPAFDQLAVFYGQRRKNLDQAHILNLKAVSLDPGNVHYRMNTAYVLEQKQDLKDAVLVLREAMKLTKDPQLLAGIQSQIDGMQNFEAIREKQKQELEEDGDEDAATPAALNDSEPKAAEPSFPYGPRHTASGTITNVHCAMPAKMTLTLTGPAEPVFLASRNYYKVAYSALNFKPEGNLNPCKDLEGAKAKIDYFESGSGSDSGEITAVEISK